MKKLALLSVLVLVNINIFAMDPSVEWGGSRSAFSRIGGLSSGSVVLSIGEDSKGSDSKKKFICAECGNGEGALSICGRCRQVRYCNRKCQKRHWRGGHKLICSSGGKK